MYLNCHTYYSFKFGTMSIEGLLKEVTAKGAYKFVLSDINNTSAILEAHRLRKDYPDKYPVQPIAGIDFRNRAQQKFIGIAKNHHGFFELNNFLSKCLQEGEKGLTGREAKIPEQAPGFENVFVIYPFSSLRGAERRPVPFSSGSNLQEDGNCPPVGRAGFAGLSTTLRQNEFIGIKPSDLNHLRFSEWKNHPEKLVALAPVTFRNKIDFNAHRLLRAMDNNIVLSKLSLSEQASPDEIMMSEEELLHLYEDFPHIIYNTKKLLDECEPVDFEFGGNKNKKYFLGSVEEDRGKLRQLCEEGMQKRYPGGGPKIRERFEKEIDVITKKQFSSYFLINHDLIKFAQHKNFFYVGRGSGANSMVAYLLYITDVDPIQLDLYFERFINPSRKNPPDFDIDFSSDERDDVIEHIFKTHGTSHTALLATYSEMKDDSLLRELGKVFGLPKAEIDALQTYRNLPQTPDHITQLIYQYKEVLKTFPAHLSIHAGGILISEKPITYYTAISNPPKGFPLTQFSMQEAEDVGFAKFDILAQRGLGKVRDAIDIIRENQGENIDIHEVERFKNDEAVRKNLKHAKLMGCFYVESPAMRMLLTKLEAETYLDLVAASSIIRPGVAQSGMMQEYIKRFHMPDHGEKIAVPELWKIMPETFGVMVYQEDVIKVAYEYGGFTLEEADKLRRGMGGKYRGRQEFLDVKDKFFSNCRERGKDEKLTDKIWFQMETFGGYAFAKGHSASYAVESYQCMFLKTHFPVEFMVAVINNGGGFFGVEYYVHEALMCGASIHAPEINKSNAETVIHGKDIYLGLGLMKDLEANVTEAILRARKAEGAFLSLNDFMKRVSISVEQLRILIRINAFRFTGRTKQQLLWDIHSILGHQKKSVARRELFEGENKKFSLPELFSDQFDAARDEIEILGFPLCSPFELIPQNVIARNSGKAISESVTKQSLPMVKQIARLPAGQASSPSPQDLPHAPSRKDRDRRNDGDYFLAADLKHHKDKIIEIVGYYVTYKPTSTKKGEAMMFGCFLDRDGYFFDTNHFPEATRKFPFHGKGCYLVKGKVAEEFGFYSINVLEMHKIDYLMYEEDADTKARSKPNPQMGPVIVPAVKECEYLLVINPPPHINREVMLLKKTFHSQFDHYQAVASKPHLTLGNFLTCEANEGEIIRQIATVTTRHASFRISLENFDVFGSHTIFIKVLNPDLIAELAGDLKKQLKLPPKSSRFIMNPHLTIARSLDKEKFTRASSLFFSLQYAATFVAGSITLLKREVKQKFSKFEVLKEFRLEGRSIYSASSKSPRLNVHS